MEKEVLNRIKAIYGKLKGFRSTAPPLEKTSTTTRDKSLWEQFNSAIDELSKLTESSKYADYKITNIRANTAYVEGSRNWIYVSDYRSKLSGLIMELHAEYFPEENEPFSGKPGVVMNQTQAQTQETNITMLMGFQTVIDEKLFDPSKLQPNEITFLEKIKKALPSVKNLLEFVKLIISTAKAVGLDINQVAQLFS